MFLALRELKHSKVRYILIIMIMVLIAWLVLFVSGLANGLSSDNAASIQNLNADYLVLEEGAENRLNRSFLTEEKIKEISQYTNSESTTPLGVQMSTITNDDESVKVDTTFFAVDTNGFLFPEVIDGKKIDQTSNKEVIVDASFKGMGFNLGDYFYDQSSGMKFKISGFTENQSYSHTPVIHMNLNDWSEMKTAMSTINKPIENTFNSIAIKGNEAVVQSVSDGVKGIEIITKSEALKGIPGYDAEQGSLLMMIIFLFIIAAFVLAVFFYVMTIQKMNQFGVLKAIGAKSSYLARSILAQVLILSLISLSIGIGLSYGMSLILPSNMPFELSISLVITCSILFLIVSILGSMLSLYRVAKVDALEAIGGNL